VSKGKPRTDRLSAAEAAQARTLAERFGAERAARKLGLCDTRAFYKAVAMLPVSKLTAGCIRLALSTRKDSI
jgi:hypothetical protein